MTSSGDRVDITKNLRIIEWLKCEMLSGMASLYRLTLKRHRDEHEALTDVIANIILVAYLFGRRFGITFAAIDLKIQSKLKLAVTEDHEIEKQFGDLSELSGYLNRKGK